MSSRGASKLLCVERARWTHRALSFALSVPLGQEGFLWVHHGFPGNTKGVPSFSPGLRRSRCPGLIRRSLPNPVRVAAAALRDATLSGLGASTACTQGRRFRANPGLKDGTPLAFSLPKFQAHIEHPTTSKV